MTNLIDLPLFRASPSPLIHRGPRQLFKVKFINNPRSAATSGRPQPSSFRSSDFSTFFISLVQRATAALRHRRSSGKSGTATLGCDFLSFLSLRGNLERKLAKVEILNNFFVLDCLNLEFLAKKRTLCA